MKSKTESEYLFSPDEMSVIVSLLSRKVYSMERKIKAGKKVNMKNYVIFRKLLILLTTNSEKFSQRTA